MSNPRTSTAGVFPPQPEFRVHSAPQSPVTAMLSAIALC